jgi:hypothetical protein
MNGCKRRNRGSKTGETHPHGFDSRRGRRAMNEYAEEVTAEENAR